MASKNEIYLINKAAKVGDNIVCPICGNEFKKKSYQQAFCSSDCKNEYWNLKGDRHKKGYYRKYNMAHPERLDRGYTNGCLNGCLSDEIERRNLSDEIKREKGTLTDEDILSLKRFGCKYDELQDDQQMEIIDEIVINDMRDEEWGGDFYLGDN